MIPSLITINDGSTQVDVPSCATLSGAASYADTQTGHGMREYADGSAVRWVRFQARTLALNGIGPVPHGLWALDLAAPSWTITYPSFRNDWTTDQFVAVPARPQESRDFNTGRTNWSISFRAANPEP